MMTTTVQIKATPVRTSWDVQQLRRIRNLCRDGFVHDNSVITAEQQTAWWNANKADVKAWLYTDTSGATVGYGLVRYSNERWWNSIAVLPNQRGNGYGAAITHDVLKQVGFRVWAQVKADNLAAVKMHTETDWMLIEEKDGIITLRSKP